MTKLDDIFEYDTLSRLHGETKAVAKGKIRYMILDLLADEDVVWTHPNGHTYIDSTELTKKVKAL